MISSLQIKKNATHTVSIVFKKTNLLIDATNETSNSSELLTIAWFLLAGTWPASRNQNLLSGWMPRPDSKQNKITIAFSNNVSCSAKFNRREQYWKEQYWKTAKTKQQNGIVIYVLDDGSIAVWLSLQNKQLSWQKQCMLSLHELQNGQKDTASNWNCNGLIRDWSDWQKENGILHAKTVEVMQCLLSGTTFGKLTRTDMNDIRDVPTLRLFKDAPEIPITRMKRKFQLFFSFVYVLVWAWNEREIAKKLMQEETTGETCNICLLLDNIDSLLPWPDCFKPRIATLLQQALQIIHGERHDLQLIALTQAAKERCNTNDFENIIHLHIY